MQVEIVYASLVGGDQMVDSRPGGVKGWFRRIRFRRRKPRFVRFGRSETFSQSAFHESAYWAVSTAESLLCKERKTHRAFVNSYNPISIRSLLSFLRRQAYWQGVSHEKVERTGSQSPGINRTR